MWFLWWKTQNCIFCFVFLKVCYENAYNFDQEWYFFIIVYAAVTGLNCPDKNLVDLSLRPPKIVSQFLAHLTILENWLWCRTESGLSYESTYFRFKHLEKHNVYGKS